jgi:glutamate--cysteine ligase
MIGRVGEGLCEAPAMQAQLQAIIPDFQAQNPKPQLGLELEMLAYDSETFAPLGTESARVSSQEMMQRIQALAPGSHLKVDFPTGEIIGLELTSGNFSLEPGGQIEYASAPQDDLQGVLDDLASGLSLMEQAGRGEVVFLDHGTNPLAGDELPLLVPKHRYQILNRYFASQPEGRGVHMMRYSATAQPNVDVIGQGAWLDAVNLTLTLTPLARALFANSRYFHGRLLGPGSERQRIWEAIDATRTGIPPVAFVPDLPSAYAEWGRKAYVFLAGDLPLEEQPRYGELTFQQWQEEGYKGTKPTPADWETHLGTLFPDLRLRRFLEVRMVDAQDFRHALAPMAFWAVALQRTQSRACIWNWLEQLAAQAGVESANKLMTLSSHLPIFSDPTTLKGLLDCVISQCQTDLERRSLNAYRNWLDERQSLVYPENALDFVRANATLEPSKALKAFLV